MSLLKRAGKWHVARIESIESNWKIWDLGIRPSGGQGNQPSMGKCPVVIFFFFLWLLPLRKWNVPCFFFLATFFALFPCILHGVQVNYGLQNSEFSWKYHLEVPQEGWKRPGKVRALLMHRLSTTQIFSFIFPISLFLCMFCGPNIPRFPHKHSCVGLATQSSLHHWPTSFALLTSANLWHLLSRSGPAITFCAWLSLHFPQFF